MTIDLDSSIVPVYGRGKQGAAFGYTKVRGYHPQFATCADTGMVLFSRLRGGSAGAAWGAKSVVTETVSRVRAAGATGQLTVRADSAFYSRAVLGSGQARGVLLGDRPSGQEDQGRDRRDRGDRLGSDPVLAVLPGSVWSRCRGDELHRVLGQGRHAGAAGRAWGRPTPWSQLALFTTWDYHAFVTNRPGDMLEIEADHRRHAVVEQRIAELKSAGLAHLPSGKFMANAAWLALTVMAHNLGRAIGRLTGHDHDLDKATASTPQRRIFTVPGRLVHSGRQRHLRLPASWPWAAAIEHALTSIQAIPLRY